MAVEQAADPAAARTEWIEARVTEFANDPSARDRAIASILFDSLMLAQGVGQMSAIVQKEGIGGLLKAVMAGGKNGSR